MTMVGDDSGSICPLSSFRLVHRTTARETDPRYRHRTEVGVLVTLLSPAPINYLTLPAAAAGMMVGYGAGFGGCRC